VDTHFLDKQRSYLPRLLYVGDVPVEYSFHGSALLARLLTDYPKERLRICEMGAVASEPSRRIPGVTYVFRANPFRRLQNTRFHRYASSIASLTAGFRRSTIANVVVQEKPDVVLTVTHGYSWIAAYRFAKRHRLPLAMIVHDDWPRLAPHIALAADWLDRKFGTVYNYASVRFCVSPAMVDFYLAKYGVAGEVLYPLRAKDAVTYDTPPPRRTPDDPFTVVFAGTVNSEGYAHLLRSLAVALSEIGGRLLIFGPLTEQDGRRIFAEAKNVELRGFFPPKALAERCRAEANALYVPMSFDKRDRANMTIGFPSKLADYTATGLPLLVHGPSWCSAVRWAQRYSGIVAIAESDTVEALRDALCNLFYNRLPLQSLASREGSLGESMFSNQVVTKQFFGALQQLCCQRG
jgi:glycosyltransferase involved in cell wall biosynthesis